MKLTIKLFDFRCDLDLDFSRSNIEFAISQPKWSHCHETKSKHIDWTLGLKCDHRVWSWPWPWPWIFKVKYRICYISAKKWSDCHETKSKHIDSTLGLKCDHLIWPWPWPWIFKVKYRICYISTQNGPIATKWNANILIELQGSNVTIRFDLGHDLDLKFSRSNMEFPIYQPKVVRLLRKEKQTYRLNSRPQMWTMGFKTLTITLTFEFWRSKVTLTFDHTHDLDHGFSWSNFEIAVSQIGRADWYYLSVI